MCCFGTQHGHCILTPLLQGWYIIMVSLSSSEVNVKLFVSCACIETPTQQVNEPPVHHSNEDLRTEALLMNMWTDNIYCGTESLKRTRRDYESWNSGRLMYEVVQMTLWSLSHTSCVCCMQTTRLFQIVLEALQVEFWCWGYSYWWKANFCNACMMQHKIMHCCDSHRSQGGDRVSFKCVCHSNRSTI